MLSKCKLPSGHSNHWRKPGWGLNGPTSVSPTLIPTLSLTPTLTLGLTLTLPLALTTSFLDPSAPCTHAPPY